MEIDASSWDKPVKEYQVVKLISRASDISTTDSILHNSSSVSNAPPPSDGVERGIGKSQPSHRPCRETDRGSELFQIFLGNLDSFRMRRRFIVRERLTWSKSCWEVNGPANNC